MLFSYHSNAQFIVLPSQKRNIKTASRTCLFTYQTKESVVLIWFESNYYNVLSLQPFIQLSFSPSHLCANIYVDQRGKYWVGLTDLVLSDKTKTNEATDYFSTCHTQTWLIDWSTGPQVAKRFNEGRRFFAIEDKY